MGMMKNDTEECCWFPVEDIKYMEKHGPMACLRTKGHSGPHECLYKTALELDELDRKNMASKND